MFEEDYIQLYKNGNINNGSKEYRDESKFTNVILIDKVTVTGLDSLENLLQVINQNESWKF
jgi:hypothetical protein